MSSEYGLVSNELVRRLICEEKKTTCTSRSRRQLRLTYDVFG